MIKYAGGMGVDWKKEIADYADYLKKQGPVVPVMPEQGSPGKEKSLKIKGWPFGADQAKQWLLKKVKIARLLKLLLE